MLKAQLSWVVISFSYQQKVPLSYFWKVKANRYPRIYASPGQSEGQLVQNPPPWGWGGAVLKTIKGAKTKLPPCEKSTEVN